MPLDDHKIAWSKSFIVYYNLYSWSKLQKRLLKVNAHGPSLVISFDVIAAISIRAPVSADRFYQNLKGRTILAVTENEPTRHWTLVEPATGEGIGWEIRRHERNR